MGIDYKNIITYGKEFDSLKYAVNELLVAGKITEEQADGFLEAGEIYCNTESGVLDSLTWNVYNAFSGGEGVLGLEFSAKQIYTNSVLTKEWTDKMDNFMSGCEWHEFVKVF